MKISEIKRLQKLAGIIKEDIDLDTEPPGFDKWVDEIYNFITTRLSSEEKELPSVIHALEKTLDKFKEEMGKEDPGYHYLSQIP